MELKLISDPNDLRSYHDSIGEMARSSTKAAYQDISRRVKSAMESLGVKSPRILLTGSDARAENPIFLRKESPGELILTATSSGPFSEPDLENIYTELRSKGFKISEVKGSGDSRLFYKGNSHAVFPTRIYDAVIAENFQTSPSERILLFEEIKQHNHRTMEHFNARLRNARKAMKTGISTIRGESRVEIDSKNGLFFYDKDNFLNGVKTGPIRVIQYGLMKFIVNRVRSGQSCEIDLTLPSNIIDRIDVLKSSHILPLSNAEAEDLKFAYGYLLYMHHMMQLGNIESGQTIFEVPADVMRDFVKMGGDLERIIEKISSK